MHKNLKSILGFVACAAASSFIAAGSANAIIVRGHVDPPFGGNASGALGSATWTADIQFSDADGDCVSGSNFNNPNVACTIDPGSLTVTGTIKDGASSAANLNFLFSNSGPTQINLDVVNGIVVAIDTPIPIAFGIGPTAQFTTGSLTGFGWIDFNFGGVEGPASIARLLVELCPPSVINDLLVRSFSEEDDCHVVPQLCTPTAPTFTSDPAAVTITQVPEPAVLWLIALGLAICTLVRRREA